MMRSYGNGSRGGLSSWHRKLLTAFVIVAVCLLVECRAWTSSQQHQRIGIRFSPSSTSTSRKSCYTQQHSLRQTAAETLLQASTSDSPETSLDDIEPSFTIRKCKYGDLSVVSEIIVNSFYPAKMIKSPFAAVLRLGELNRLQQNFPYSDDKHFMFVAIGNSKSEDQTGDDDAIIGFVDLDARPATRRIDPPRPYLSDLAVHPDFRRRGIASTFIQKCEGLARDKFKKPSLYIRVEQANDAAVQMYEQFEYEQLEHEVFGVEDTTVLLCKTFNDGKDKNNDHNDDDETEQEQPALDYVV